MITTNNVLSPLLYKVSIGFLTENFTALFLWRYVETESTTYDFFSFNFFWCSI